MRTKSLLRPHYVVTIREANLFMSSLSPLSVGFANSIMLDVEIIF